MPARSLRALVGAALVLFCAGCGFIDYFFMPPPEDTAQELYEAGIDAMKEKDYSHAQTYFNKLKDRFPFSPLTPKAEIALGDAYYLDEKYFEAGEAYKEFASLHPTHEEIAYVYYQVGMSHLRQFKSIDRPQTDILEALEYFYRVEEGFPDSKYATQSKAYIVQCRTLLAEHELYIADFFWRTNRFGPAWQRYRYVAKNFGDLKDIQTYARKQAEMAYYEYQKTLSQEERDRIEGDWKRWFDWL